MKKLAQLCAHFGGGCVLALFAAGAARAHAPEADHYTAQVSEWAIDPLSVGLLVLLAGVYWRGSTLLARRRHYPGEHRRRAAAFWSAWAALAIAFGPPLEPLTAVSFAAHMAQHELIMLIAAPLLVLARPSGVLLWGLPSGAAGLLASLARARAMRACIEFFCTPLAAGLLHFAVLWVWHMPAAFEAGLANEVVHWLQHVSFFVSAWVFWFAVLAAGRGGERRGAALISMLATVIHTGILGALLTFSPSVWYGSYRVGTGWSGLTPLEDQQLGGLIMWVPGGAVFLVAGVVLMGLWLKEAETRAT